MAEKQTSKDRMREIVDSIENGIKELFESDKYRKYLATRSRFHRYSVNKTMLIYMQRPDATHVAGFNKWRDQFGRNVLKGEKGIRIIAPTPYKKKVLTKSLAAALLKNGRAPLKGCYSEKTGKTYDAVVLLEDDGQRTGYKLVFDNG